MGKTDEVQTSESLICGIILALSGGCMDAYSYLFRGEVFANAQTGNLLLFGVNLANKNIAEALYYLWPILAFTLGILLANVARNRCRNLSWIHWRQITVAIEAVFLVVVAYIPQEYNLIATVIISFVCGVQVESFKKIQGNSIATTMCIGNLRSGTYNFSQYRYTGDVENLKRGFIYYGIIFAFVVGAVIESLFIEMMHYKAIFFSSILLVIALLVMFRSPDNDDSDAYIEG